MKKEEFIERYGEEAWAKKLFIARRARVTRKVEVAQTAKDAYAHLNSREQQDALRQLWKKENPKRCAHPSKITGIQAERNEIRKAHNAKWRNLKQHFFQELDIHHHWVEGTANYLGVALVERGAHRKGIIKVVQILEGELVE